MEALDGNAIGGLLIELFGSEMTDREGECAHCGAVMQVAELSVYLEAPGVVGRCRSCDGVLLVVVEAHGVRCVDFTGLASL
jgi:hypothetical protein